jgi:hypothetical protein
MNPPPHTEHALMDDEHRVVLDWAQEGAKRLREARPMEESLYAVDVQCGIFQARCERRCREGANHDSSASRGQATARPETRYPASTFHAGGAGCRRHDGYRAMGWPVLGSRISTRRSL